MFLQLHKDWLKTLLAGGFVLLLLGVSAAPTAAQNSAPRGSYIQVGPAFAPGMGLNVGTISAKTLYTTEFQLISDLQSVVSGPEYKTRITALIGVSVRVFGFERLLGNAAYRGFDIDLGFRVGPGLSFSTRDSRIDKNRRFILVVEPVARLSRATNRFVGFVELGTESPHVRLGVWIPW